MIFRDLILMINSLIFELEKFRGVNSISEIVEKCFSQIFYFLLTVEFSWHIVNNALLCIGIFDCRIIIGHKITLKRKKKIKCAIEYRMNGMNNFHEQKDKIYISTSKHFS